MNSKPDSENVDHWSGPNGCHPDCPACEGKKVMKTKPTHTPTYKAYDLPGAEDFSIVLPTVTGGEHVASFLTRERRDEFLESVNEYDQDKATIKALVETIESRCAFHHLPLHNGWAHRIKTPMGQRTARCHLSKKEHKALAQAQGNGE